MSGLISSGELPSGTNLDNIVENLTNHFSVANSSTLINIPEAARGNAGILIVKEIGFVYQFLITRNNVVFIRSSWNNNGTYTWNNWSQK